MKMPGIACCEQVRVLLCLDRSNRQQQNKGKGDLDVEPPQWRVVSSPRLYLFSGC